MNKNICLRCHRYAENDDRPESWWCAKELTLLPSAVVPNHSCYSRDRFVPITNQTQNPPLWCEFLMEQSITTPTDDVPTPIPMTDLVYVGCEEQGEDESDPEIFVRSPSHRIYWTTAKGELVNEYEDRYKYPPTMGIQDEEFEELVKAKVEVGLSVVRKLKGEKDAS